MPKTALLLLLTLAGCATATITTGDRCEVRIDRIDPAAPAPGETVVITGGPLTSHYDTAAWVGDTRAVVQSVDRSSCEACDTCREDAACSACDDCDDCASVCDTTCIETVSITLPDLDSGPTTAVLYNGYGSSDPFPLDVAGGGGDSGSSDSGTSDSGTADRAAADPSAADAGR